MSSYKNQWLESYLLIFLNLCPDKGAFLEIPQINQPIAMVKLFPWSGKHSLNRLLRKKIGLNWWFILTEID
jgi:hypothetical protein